MAGENHTGSNLRVLHLSTLDRGGAGIAAWRLHKALRQEGVDSRMLVLEKSLADESIVASGQHAKESWQQVWRRWMQFLAACPGRPEGLEIFSDFQGNVDYDLISEVREADVLNFHWVAGMMGGIEPPRAFRGKPIVWTLHDMNPFTGGCHYAGRCEKYREGCTSCFQLGECRGDTAADIWRAKQRFSRDLDITVVTPSTWLGRCARDSGIFGGRRIEVIPNGIPTDVFAPMPRKEVREKLRLGQYGTIMLFCADQAANQRKGFRYLLEALQQAGDLPEDTALAILGSAAGLSQLQFSRPVLSFGSLQSPEKVAIACNAADFFVLPSLEDNLPNTMLEALACGIPVVATGIGGMPDVIEHGRTGYLVPPADPQGLLEGIRWAISVKDCPEVARACRARAEEFAARRQAAKYLELYSDVLRTPKLTQPAVGLPLPAQERRVAVSVSGTQKRKRPRITIVTPSFNQAPYLESCITSILEQGYPDLEYMVVDGGSTDGSVEIIRKYAKHLAWSVSEPDSGQYHAINKGFARSTGGIMAWLNSDDMLHPGALATVADIMSDDGPVEWLMGAPTIRDAQGRTVIVNPPIPWTRARYLSGSYKWIQQESTFWRRSLWQRAGGTLNTAYSLAADTELWFRFFRHARFFAANVLLGGFRCHGEQKTARSMDKYLEEAEEILAAELRQFLRASDDFLPPPQPIINYDMAQRRFIIREAAAGTGGTGESLAELSRKAQDLAKAGNFSEALQELIALVPFRREAPDLCAIMANLYLATGHPRAARVCFERVLELDPKNRAAAERLKSLPAASEVADATHPHTATAGSRAAAAAPASAVSIPASRVVPAEKFDDFVFSKKNHLALFGSRSPMGPDSDLKAYQDALVLNFILDNIPEGARLLEVGGGESRIIAAIENRYECWNIDKLEGLGNGPLAIRPKGHRLIRDYMGNFNRELPANYFDLVFSISTLEHVPEDEATFRNICLDIDRVLKPGGYSLHCFDIIVRNDGVWTNRLLPFISGFFNTLHRFVPLSELRAHPDLWGMSQLAYERGWAHVTKKSYAEHGMPVSYNVLWRKQPDGSHLKQPLTTESGESPCVLCGQDRPLVSAIVSTYRSQRHIAECIEDLERQTIADRLEIVVIDSGSPENEGEIVRRLQQKYSNIKYIRTDRRESVYQAWNRGIRASSGRYITNANTDDRHRANAFEVMVRALENNPDKGLAYARFVGVREVSGARQFYYDSPSEPYTRERLLAGLLVGPQPMWRRSLHEMCGFFDEGLVVSSDYEFWLRIAQHTDLLFIDQTLGEFLEDGESVCHLDGRLVACFESAFVRNCYREAYRRGLIIGREGLTGSSYDFIANWYATRLVRRHFSEKFGHPCPSPVRLFEKRGSHAAVPAVSVVVLADSGPEALKATLQSLAAHKDRVELILVGSSIPPAAAGYLEGLICDTTVIHLAEDLGPVFARHLAAGGARASILAFVDAGLVPDQDWFRNTLAALSSSEVVAIRGRIRTPPGLASPRVFDLGDEPLPGVFETPQFCAVRRSAYEAVGGFNPLALAHHGIELGFKLFEHTGRIDAIMYKPEVTATATIAELCEAPADIVSDEALADLSRRFPELNGYYTSISSFYPWCTDDDKADFIAAFNAAVILRNAAPNAAMKWARRAVDLEPLAMRACFVLGSLCARIGRFNEAIPLLERVLTLSRRDLTAFAADPSSFGRQNWENTSGCYVNAAALLAQSFFKLNQLGKAKTVYMHLLECPDLLISPEQRQSFASLVSRLDTVAPEPVEDGLADVPAEAFEKASRRADAAPVENKSESTAADEPVVTAIVSTYNSEAFIRGCLEDLERQTIADRLEIIVIDSGSQQHEGAIVRQFQEKYGNIRYMKTPRESLYAAWNRAVQVARGRYLTNANTDDRHRPDALEILARELDRNPDVALVWADQYRTDTPDATFESFNLVDEWKWDDYNHERLKLGCCVGSQPMWRASVHKDVGYFDETLTCAGDWDMWLRIAEKYPLKHVPQFLGLYYINPAGIELGNTTHSLYERYLVGRRYGTPYIAVIPFVDGPQYPLVSVVMPACNDEKFIAEAIESVLIQNYRRFEFIIVDDGSTDSTPAIIERYKDQRLKHIRKANGGPASARNAGIHAAGGSFVVFVDADDVICHDYLLEHMRAFQANPSAHLIYCDHTLIDEDGHYLRELRQFEYTDRTSLIRDMFRCGYPVIQPRGMLRRSVFDEIGLFDESLVSPEDYELMVRFVKAGLNAVHLPKALYKRRIRRGSLTQSETPIKTESYFAVIDSLLRTFSHTELFPDVNWVAVPPDKIAATAANLIGATLLAIARNYHAAGKPVRAQQALSRAIANLRQSAACPQTHAASRHLLRDCELLYRQILLADNSDQDSGQAQEVADCDDNKESPKRDTMIIGT
jgi:glycosyltransferase involved in cell wall biosynthesis